MDTHFKNNVLDRQGPEQGRAWLEALPGLIDAAVERWSLHLEPPFQPLGAHWVAPATRRTDSAAVVLKLARPSRHQHAEATALATFDGHGCVHLLDSALEDGALLLERARPGHTAAHVALDDAATTDAVASVMQQLWRPVPASAVLPTLADLGRGFARLRARFEGGSGPLPPRAVDQAERTFVELVASAAPAVLLHGDLHHHNLLAAQRQPWLAIDPHGLIGEPAYEVGAWLRNPLPGLLEQPDPRTRLARRLDQLAERLDLDRQRLQAWAHAQAILAAVWSIEDHDGCEAFFLACAEHLDPTHRRPTRRRDGR